ncbi:uncharacterized protein LOC108848238 [Raphanus sativus]|uniref:Uncharacterized protein LOC108848238 n=1 Tax=Raphanus sativus TaxID=3726 RepID=A0A6J0MY59_RAPSA|nr:uncharacterized protein LOC108848238 [Raphanus sativus]
MDSRNPLNPDSQSPSLVGLLNSQNFPYESYQDSVNFGASEIPPFSSQQTDTPLAFRERKEWKPADDEVIISAWINTSKDPIVGNSQNSGTFWARVGDYYAASPHGRAQGEGREHLNIKQRWHKINDFTNKFCAAHAAAERQISSGQSDHDVLKLAHDIYYTNNNKKFTLEHAWCLLRYEQKWLSLNTPKPSGSSKRKACETPSESSNTTAADHEVRPEGLVSMGRYSYSQPSLSDDYGDTGDSMYSETEELIRRDQEELIRRDQEELILQYGETAQYPPQPEVEFGFPQTCYCDGEPLLTTSYTRNDPGRRFYTC